MVGIVFINTGSDRGPYAVLVIIGVFGKVCEKSRTFSTKDDLIAHVFTMSELYRQSGREVELVFVD